MGSSSLIGVMRKGTSLLDGSEEPKGLLMSMMMTMMVTMAMHVR